MASKVSLKDIIKSIDDTLAKLEDTAAEAEARSVSGKYERERARKMLKGIRQTLEGICVPGFDVPEP